MTTDLGFTAPQAAPSSSAAVGSTVNVPPSLSRFIAALSGSKERFELISRQLRIMELVYTRRQPMQVRDLARELSTSEVPVSKPVITRALNTLATLGYVRRARNEDDRRDSPTLRTAKGQRWWEDFIRDATLRLP